MNEKISIFQLIQRASTARELRYVQNLRTRFWSKVDKNGPEPDQAVPQYAGLGACWLWTAACNSHGYGQLGIAGMGMQSAHRLSYQLCVGEIPHTESAHGTCVLHKCDNPLCVNPAHLRLGSNRENIQDAAAKQRMRKGDTHPARIYSGHILRGERAVGSIVTTAQVKELRMMHAAKRHTQKALALIFGIKVGHVNDIVRRRTWQHV